MDSLKQNENITTSGKMKMSEKGAGFRSLISTRIHADSEKNSPSGGENIRAEMCKKNVEVICDKGIVKSIKVTCSCGEVTEIDCQYTE